ncbi:MAG: Gfo/Idh/MocA family oxidoreductase, partial [Lentisphaeria bacterium]|nr:Gfo/Idh/MocA family oxidoreductase [Lentisphaeria bacterium]
MSGKLRIGIVGTGSRGTACFGKLLSKRNDVEITALCDPNPVRMRGAAKILGIDPRFYTDMGTMGEKETLDGVIITSPDAFHHDCAMTALRHGWNVLIDKPLATNVKDGREIIEYARKAGKSVMIGFNLRHHAVLKRLKKIIEEGTLGKIFLAENREFYGGGRTYMARWNRLFSMTGGLWIHKASHDFDIFNWLLDFPRPVRIASFAAVNVLKPSGIPFALEKGIQPGPDCNSCHYREICKDRWLLGEEELLQWGPEAVKEDGYIKNRCIYTSDKDNHDNGLCILEYENNVKVSLFETFIGNKGDRRYTVNGDKAIAEASLSERRITITPRCGGEVTTITLPAEDGGHG